MRNRWKLILLMINPLVQKELLFQLLEDIGPRNVSKILLRDNLMEFCIQLGLFNYCISHMIWQESTLYYWPLCIQYMLNVFQLAYRPFCLLKVISILCCHSYHTLDSLIQHMTRQEHVLIGINVTNFLSVVIMQIFFYRQVPIDKINRLFLSYVFSYTFKVLAGVIFNNQDLSSVGIGQITRKHLENHMECMICYEHF